MDKHNDNQVRAQVVREEGIKHKITLRDVIE